ncbi:MAG: methylated-DNA--[protein]-cysteine S-methyltransferase [Candidatus Komeilibacteria bacterium]
MTFYDQVYHLTKKIPRGRVASYGQIASLISTPRAARVVGWCLHVMDNDSALPWHRVINSKGYISTTCETHPADLQAALLKKEGIKVTRKDNLWWIDMKQYQWKP